MLVQQESSTFKLGIFTENKHEPNLIEAGWRKLF